jgi:hypothetical protein
VTLPSASFEISIISLFGGVAFSAETSLLFLAETVLALGSFLSLFFVTLLGFLLS